MKTTHTLVVALLMSGCAGLPQQQPTQKQEIVSGVQQLPPVSVPVLTPCVTADEVPAVPVTIMKPDSMTTEQLVIAARIDIVNWRRYAVVTDSLLRGCIAVFDKSAPAQARPPAPSVPQVTAPSPQQQKPATNPLKKQQ